MGFPQGACLFSFVFFLKITLKNAVAQMLNIYLFLCLQIEKDWEDIRKMPEHQQLMKDFKRSA